MKKFLLLTILFLGIAFNSLAQNDKQPTNKKYEFLAEVNCHRQRSSDKYDYDYVTRSLYELYSYESYYIDEYGRKQYKWTFKGYYLKDENGSYYKVINNYSTVGYGSKYKYMCNGLSCQYYFNFDF